LQEGNGILVKEWIWWRRQLYIGFCLLSQAIYFRGSEEEEFQRVFQVLKTLPLKTLPLNLKHYSGSEAVLWL
jgi:hypothetical protein